MSFSPAGSGESGILALGSSLTIENAARIREELIRVFHESDNVVLKVLEDVVADVSFMQILCSAKKTALIEKKRFMIDWSAAPGVRQSLENAGYNSAELCFLAAHDKPRSVGGGSNG